MNFKCRYFDCVQRTLLCMLMVYSRVTTSAMAERVFLPVLTGADISVVEEIMLGWGDSRGENKRFKQICGEISLTE